VQKNKDKIIVFLLSQNDIGGHTKFVLNLSKLLKHKSFDCQIYVPYFTHYFYTKNFRRQKNLSDVFLWTRYFLSQLKSLFFVAKFKWRGDLLGFEKFNVRRYTLFPKKKVLEKADLIITSAHWDIELLLNLGVNPRKILHVIHHLHSNKKSDLKIFIEDRKFALAVSSEFTSKECNEYGIKDFSVCNLGVDLKMFNPSKRNRAIDNVIRVGFFYYNHPRKNPRLIESVIAILIREHPDIEIHIFGNGFNNAGGNVILAEGINEYTYAESIANLDLFVYISKIEGFGLPPLEAMASGVPVIASDVGAVTSYMNNGVNGIILENDCSATNIVNSIERVLRSRDLKNRFSENGVLASQNWSWSKTCDDYLAIFENINE